MKKRILISLVLILLALILIFVYWYNYSGKMISKDIEDINNIIITVYPCDEEKKDLQTVEDIGEIEKIYTMLKETTKIRNNRCPSHAVSVQWDPKFEIDILYKNGEQEHIFSTEATGYVCKYLNGLGSSDDKGYRLGKNQAIWDYIFSK